MSGLPLTLGLVGALALAELLAKRGTRAYGSASVDPSVLKEVLRDFLSGSRRVTPETYEKIYAESDAYGLGRSAPLGDWSAIRDASPSSLRVMMRILADSVGRDEVERALRDYVGSRTPEGKMARVVALAKRDAKHVLTERDLVIADFYDGRLILFPKEGNAFQYRRGDMTSNPGAFSTIHSVGGWTSFPRPAWPESAHRAYEDVILPRQLGADYPTVPPVKVVVVGPIHKPMPQGWERKLPGRKIPPTSQQVPSLFRFDGARVAAPLSP